VNDRYTGTIWLHCDAFGTLTQDASGCTEDALRATFEETYLGCYVQLSRLLGDYERLSTSTAREDAIRELHDIHAGRLTAEVSRIRAELESSSEQAGALQTQISSVLQVEQKLRNYIDSLALGCEDEEEVWDTSPGYGKPELLAVGSGVAKTPGLAERNWEARRLQHVRRHA